MKTRLGHSIPPRQQGFQNNVRTYTPLRTVRARDGVALAANRSTPRTSSNTYYGREKASDSLDNGPEDFDCNRDASPTFYGYSVNDFGYGRQAPYTSPQGPDRQAGEAWTGSAQFDVANDEYYDENHAYASQTYWDAGTPLGDGGANWGSERWARRTENASDDTMKWLGGAMAVAGMVLVAGQWIAEHPVVLLPPLFLFFFTPLGGRLASTGQPSTIYTTSDGGPWYRDDLASTVPSGSTSRNSEADSWAAPAGNDPEMPAYKSPANQAWAAAQLAARRAAERATARLGELEDEVVFRGRTFWRENSAWAARQDNAAGGVDSGDVPGPLQSPSSGARGDDSGFGRRFSKPAGGGSPSRSPAVAPVSALSVSASALYLPTGSAAATPAVGKTAPEQQVNVEVVEPEEIIAPDDFSARRRAQPASSRWEVLKQRQQSQAGANAGRYKHWKRTQRAQATAANASPANGQSAPRDLTIRPVRQRVTAAQMARGGAIQRVEAPWSGGIIRHVWGDPATRARYINTVRATRQPVVNALLKLFPWLRSWGGLL